MTMITSPSRRVRRCAMATLKRLSSAQVMNTTSFRADGEALLLRTTSNRKARRNGGVKFDEQGNTYHRNPSINRMSAIEGMWFSAQDFEKFQEEDAQNMKSIAIKCRKKMDQEQSMACPMEKKKALAFRLLMDELAEFGQTFQQASTPNAEFVGLERYVSKAAYQAQSRRQAAVVKAVMEAQESGKQHSIRALAEKIRKASLDVSNSSATQAQVIAQAAVDLES